MLLRVFFFKEEEKEEEEEEKVFEVFFRFRFEFLKKKPKLLPLLSLSLSSLSTYQIVDVRDVDRVLEHVVVLALHLDRAVNSLPLRVLELRDVRDRRALVLGEVGGAF